MYSKDDVELALLVVGEGMSRREAAELVGCGETDERPPNLPRERAEARRAAGEGVFSQAKLSAWDCGGNPGPNPSYATSPKSLRYCMGLL